MPNSVEALIRIIAIIVLAFELPVPLYWLVLHLPVSFWRRHVRVAFLVAVLAAWGITDLLLYAYRRELFQTDALSGIAFIGLILIAMDIFTFTTSEAVLGGRRIVGHSELAGSRELIARGLYAHVRHPRYLGMISGVLGACLIVALPVLWAVALLWTLLVLLNIRAEERELHARLGPAYAVYTQNVPALLPIRLGARSKRTAPRREHRS